MEILGIVVGILLIVAWALALFLRVPPDIVSLFAGGTFVLGFIFALVGEIASRNDHPDGTISHPKLFDLGMIGWLLMACSGLIIGLVQKH